MYKTILGNTDYKISLECEIVSSDEKACTLNVKDGSAYIELYGKLKWWDIRWLSLLAHYEVDLPNKLSLVKFLECHPNMKRCGMVMIFNLPIYYKEGFRVVPGFPRYAVTNSGTVMDTKTDSILELASGDYYTVRVKDPDRNLVRKIGIHRLVAFAWNANVDYVNNYMVNHINGIKTDNRSINLEWCTPTENANHAIRTGLRNDNIACRVRDITTGQVTEHYSTSDAYRYMGLGNNGGRPIYETIRLNKLIVDRYELRKHDDLRPWVYSDLREPLPAGRYIINVTMPEGDQLKFYDARDFKKRLKLWNVGSVDDMVEKAKKLYPGILVEVIDQYAAPEIEAKNMVTGEIVQTKTMTTMAKYVGTDKTTIQNKLRKTIQTNCVGDWVVRYKTDKPWVKQETILKPVCISAYNQSEDKTIVFNSLRETAKYFQVDRSVIKSRLDTTGMYNGWTFKTIPR